MRIDELDTPALLIDIDRVERNVKRLAAYCREHNLKLRPHTKTHKLPELSRLQVENGAWGITVAKVGEAEVMAQGGLDNILIAYPLLGGAKAQRLAALARGRRITVGLDSRESAESVAEAARAAGTPIDVLVEIDTGFHRCGVTVAELPALARAVAAMDGLRFAGIMFYPGHLHIGPEQQPPAMALQNSIVEEALAALKRDGIECGIVSGGSTPTWYNSHLIRGMTEIRSGTYIYNDRNTVYMGAAEMDDCALTVLCTVVSTAVPERIMLDGGSKTLSSDGHLGGAAMGYGEIFGRPDLVVAKLNEEHGHIVARDRHGIATGDKVRVLMNHACACMHLHENVYLHRGDEVVGCYRVAGRGKLQ